MTEWEPILSLWVGRAVLLAGGLALTAWLISLSAEITYQRYKCTVGFWGAFVEYQRRRRKPGPRDDAGTLPRF